MNTHGIAKRLILAGIVLAILVLLPLYLTGLTNISLWQGEPVSHLSRQNEIIQMFCERKEAGENPYPAFVNAYFRYPKPLSDMINAAAGIATRRCTPVADPVHHQKVVWSVVLTVSALSFLIAFSLLLRKHLCLYQILIVVVLMLSDTYFLLYSGFPRQNMVAHAMGWIIMMVYFNIRSHQSQLSPNAAILLGAGCGIATLCHYSSIQIVYLILICEAAFLFLDRKFLATPMTLAIFLCGIVTVWAAVDMGYHFTVINYPECILNPKYTSSIMTGFFHSIARLDNREMAWKIGSTPWHFAPSFLIASANPVTWLLLPVGMFVAFRNTFNGVKHFSIRSSRAKKYTRWSIFLCIACIMFFAQSFRYFCCARKLAYYVPFLAVLAVIGLRSAVSYVPRSRPLLKYMVILAALLCGLAYQMPKVLFTFRCIRSQSYINDWIKTNKITEMYKPATVTRKEPMLNCALVPITLSDIKKMETGYLYTYRMMEARLPEDRNADHTILSKALSSIKPVVSHEMYSAHSIYYYEFPIRPEIYDFGDPLGNCRRIYRIKDVKKALQNMNDTSPTQVP